MHKKKIAAVVVVSIVVLYSIAILLGLLSLGVLSVYTDKNEYKLNEKITISSKNNGITILCGVPYWYVYKINDSNETLVYWNAVKGPQYVWPQGYFGVEGKQVVWNPSEGFDYGRLKVGPQKEGTYKIVAKVGGRFNTSASKIIIIR